MKNAKFRGLVELVSTGKREWVYYGVGSKPSLCGAVWIVEDEQFIDVLDEGGFEVYEDDVVMGKSMVEFEYGHIGTAYQDEVAFSRGRFYIKGCLSALNWGEMSVRIVGTIHDEDEDSES